MSDPVTNRKENLSTRIWRIVAAWDEALSSDSVGRLEARVLRLEREVLALNREAALARRQDCGALIRGVKNVSPRRRSPTPRGAEHRRIR
jgi:hypothetical protein